MITNEIYNEYFGVDTAPTNLTRLEFISLEILKTIITKPIPAETDVCYGNFLKALMEQIKFIDENEDILSISGGGYSLGKFSEGSSGDKKEPKKISPMAYSILLNCNLLYVGM